MFINTGKASIMGATRCLQKFAVAQPFHTSAKALNYVAPLPLPNNVDAAETTRFSPQRSRDISATVMSAQAPISTIDITNDNSQRAQQALFARQDPHLQSYDCFGSVSLNAVMQSNVPTPYGGNHKFSHLNMPGGQWSQDSKFMSQDLQSSHYRALRDNARSAWGSYDQNATVRVSSASPLNKGLTRSFSTQAAPPTGSASAPVATPVATSTATPEATPAAPALSKKEQLKRAFKDYGGTIVAFHVSLSLMSLGGFYLLVSSGINVVPVMEFLGIGSSAIADKIATGSTFVVAYAVHKVFAPVRISITLGSAPFIVRYLRTKGFLKPKTKAT